MMTKKEIEKRKEKAKLSLADLRVEAKHLISNIDIALSHLDDEMETEKDVIAFVTKYDIRQGLKHIKLS